MPSVEFHARFGGEASPLQELEDLKYQLPAWSRPLWSAFVKWLTRWVRRLQIKREMESVDRQARVIGDQWAAAERAVQTSKAFLQAKDEFPEAKVEVVKMPDHPVDAVRIEHPPDPNDAAQVALGFGVIEIRSAVQPTESNLN